MRPKENENDKNDKGLIQEECVPKYIQSRINKLPFDDRADGKIYTIPKANEPIGTFPDFRYTFKPLQVCKILF